MSHNVSRWGREVFRSIERATADRHVTSAEAQQIVDSVGLYADAYENGAIYDLWLKMSSSNPEITGDREPLTRHRDKYWATPNTNVAKFVWLGLTRPVFEPIADWLAGRNPANRPNGG